MLVTIGILAILIAISFPAYSAARQHANCAGCASNMRTLGIAFITYANDNDMQLPGHAANGGDDKWPVLLLPYVGKNPRAYVDPGDPVAMKTPTADLISNAANHSSFIFNGFDDVGFFTDHTSTLRLVNLTSTSNLILLGQQVQSSTQFYMDFEEGNQKNVLNKTAYFGGANYCFADGSVRYLRVADYDDTMWLVNKSYTIP